jgi:pseudomonalisin/xanthomonalisin
MQSCHFKKLALSALVLAAFGASAKSGESWVPTQTLAQDGGTAVHGLALRAGELVHVTVSLELRNESKLDALANSLLAGKPAQHITSDEFLKTYAPSAASVEAVVEHLTKSGFVNIEVAKNNLLVSADGSAATVKQAFNAELHHFTTVDGRDAYANVTDAQVPASLKGIVKAVIGLQTIELSHTMIKEAAVTPDASSITGHSPTDFPTIYDANGLPPATKTVLGIISDGNMTQTKADLATFVAQAGFATPSVTYEIVGSAGTDTSGTPEWDLDSQDALSAAGGSLKQIIFYVATSLSDSALTQAYNQVVTDNTAKVINVSLGECENTAKSSGVSATDDAIFKTAVAQGQTFSVSSGDSGSHECTKRKNADSYPAVSPYVIALGGTTLSTTGTTTWAGETVWVDGGGGPSLTEAAPAWQKSSGVLKGGTKRGVPDLAFDSDPNSGSKIIVNGKTAQYGGTSLAAPLFSGFWARIQSANNNTLVFPASALYQFGPTNAALFHDVTSGNNGGYSAAAGWDYTTGFGSLDVGSFAAFVASHSGF